MRILVLFVGVLLSSCSTVSIDKQRLPHAIYNSLYNKDVIVIEVRLDNTVFNIDALLKPKNSYVFLFDKLWWKKACFVLSIDNKLNYYEINPSTFSSGEDRQVKAKMFVLAFNKRDPNKKYFNSHVFLLDESLELFPFVYDKKYFPDLSLPQLLMKNYWTKKITYDECLQY